MAILIQSITESDRSQARDGPESIGKGPIRGSIDATRTTRTARQILENVPFMPPAVRNISYNKVRWTTADDDAGGEGGDARG